MKNDKFADVEFDERAVPISRQFDDPYFSFQDGLAESEYVFLRGNSLPERLQDGFQIAELGFGTGLNALLTWRAWAGLKRQGIIRMTSFEAFPMSLEDRARALSHFPTIQKFSKQFLEQFNGSTFSSDGFHLEIIEGDARETLSAWKAKADAWYLDGFSPAKNPELWNASLMQDVYKHTTPQGTFATYSAAGFVRQNLTEAGFLVERIQGFGHKRHMTIGRRV